MKDEEMLQWLTDRIADVDHDLTMDRECKAERRPVPFGENNHDWLKSIEGRKDAFEDVKAHIIAEQLNKAIMLAKGLEA